MRFCLFWIFMYLFMRCGCVLSGFWMNFKKNIMKRNSEGFWRRQRAYQLRMSLSVRTQTTYNIEPSPYSPKRSSFMSLAAWMPSSFRFFSICLLLARAARSSAEEVHPILQVPSVQNVAPVFFTTRYHKNPHNYFYPTEPVDVEHFSLKILTRITNTGIQTFFFVRQGSSFPVSSPPLVLCLDVQQEIWQTGRRRNRRSFKRTSRPPLKRTHAHR